MALQDVMKLTALVPLSSVAVNLFRPTDFETADPRTGLCHAQPASPHTMRGANPRHATTDLRLTLADRTRPLMVMRPGAV